MLNIFLNILQDGPSTDLKLGRKTDQSIFWRRWAKIKSKFGIILETAYLTTDAVSAYQTFPFLVYSLKFKQ